MPGAHHAAGALLRQLRCRRGLTLRQAAGLLSSSPGALSRKERGIDAVGRHDVIAAITAYQLSPWEAYDLWLLAGYLPEPAHSPARLGDVRAFAQPLLLRMTFPAFIVDALGYLLAWNAGFEAIWQPSQAGPGRIHMVGALFAPRQRARLDTLWEAYVLQALQVFYRRTRLIAHDPAFLALLADIQAQYAEFEPLWKEAQHRAIGVASVPLIERTVVIVPHDSPAGSIEYLALQSVVQLPQPYELFVYVPFGQESERRYDHFRALMGPQRVYFAEAAERLEQTTSRERTHEL
ncbi:MAG: helix-turn-helix domain-containing protein [Oscillochloridaceae bacterium]|nr:helix-turn-helix transcriptional regulator [Chloroflexaceae bacterium]MDW8389981.1 helix-turn-helix domain-containing protein [Oscillochloridaceae bacterium]